MAKNPKEVNTFLQDKPEPVVQVGTEEGLFRMN